MRSICLLGIAALTLSAGCTPNDITMGGAVRHDMAVQVIDPDPPAPAAMASSGERAADAVTRYREGRVRQPVAQTTTTIAGTGGGAGMSGGASGGSGPN